MLRVLSIDGGGIRGIIPAGILVELERRLRLRLHNPQAHLADYIDVFMGTSTGAILAAGLVCPDEHHNYRFTPELIQALYLEKGEAIFRRSTWQKVQSGGGLFAELHSPLALEKYLHYFFEDVAFSQVLKPLLVPVYRLDERATLVLESYGQEDFLLRDVLRASSAAPIFFPPARVTSLNGTKYLLADGAVFANNPAMAGLTRWHWHQPKWHPSELFVISLGTGIKPVQKEAFPDEGGILAWVRPLLDIMMESLSFENHLQLEALLQAKGNYIRISPPLRQASADMDRADSPNIKALQEATSHWIDDNGALLDQIIHKLLATPS